MRSLFGLLVDVIMKPLNIIKKGSTARTTREIGGTIRQVLWGGDDSEWNAALKGSGRRLGSYHSIASLLLSLRPQRPLELEYRSISVQLYIFKTSILFLQKKGLLLIFLIFVIRNNHFLKMLWWIFFSVVELKWSEFKIKSIYIILASSWFNWGRVLFVRQLKNIFVLRNKILH